MDCQERDDKIKSVVKDYHEARTRLTKVRDLEKEASKALSKAAEEVVAVTEQGFLVVRVDDENSYLIEGDEINLIKFLS